MKPSTLRYIRLEQDVWSLLWRVMPKACKQLRDAKHISISIQVTKQKPQTITIKHI